MNSKEQPSLPDFLKPIETRNLNVNQINNIPYSSLDIEESEKESLNKMTEFLEDDNYKNNFLKKVKPTEIKYQDILKDYTIQNTIGNNMDDFKKEVEKQIDKEYWNYTSDLKDERFKDYNVNKILEIIDKKSNEV